ncbi:hypothetical protein [Gordonia rubripertincta]|uniref:hypothetical protein n=1 Tax=Gordonia rubripertincta TaxID=36822 RepID=UPI0015FA43E7|nr:hypothetical protein [Gordonia rubripertincta]QMU22495.1 hypothetical protein H3V45_08520 [Gordonia rubripertincta]
MSVSTSTSARLIFGREPAAISAAIMVAVALIGGFLTPVSSQAQALIQAAVGGVLALIVAVQVRENVVPAVLAALQAVIPLAVYAGLDWTPEQQGLVFTATSVVLGLIAGRPNLTPKADMVAGEVVAVRDEPIA